MIDKKSPLLSLLFLLLLASISHAAEKPNIILLMGDDHGWEETGYNGHPDLKTPVLDQMAATGLRLDRFYAAHPSCSPTRGSVLTGRHPNRYGTLAAGYSLRPEEVTVAQLLGKAGYLRGHFGKWHVGAVKAGAPVNPGAMGFDEWVSHDNFFELDPPLSVNGGAPKIHPGESSAVIVDEAIRFIKNAKSEGKPFLSVVWFGSPHEPYSGLPEDLALYDGLPEKYADQGTVALTSNETGRRVKRPLGEVLRERYAEITAMDRSIGTLRDFLEAEGLRDNTLVIYCGDNGTPSSGALPAYSPLRGVKATVYEGGIRVPAVIEWPAQIAEARSSDYHAVTSDILLTLCALAEVPVADDRPLDGVNLMPMLTGEAEQRATPIFFWNFMSRAKSAENGKPWIDAEMQEGTTPLVKLSGDIATRNFKNFHHPKIVPTDYLGPRVMLGNRYKLVIHESKDDAQPQIELFDLDADQAEENNLAEREPEQVETMQKDLLEWQESVLHSLTGADYSE